MQKLFILYDERCGLCRWARRWLERQPAFLELEFLPADHEETRRRFPALASQGRPDELVVVSDEGGVYRGGSAWVMVLYALRDYREWSLRLGSTALLPLARPMFQLLSTHRGALSRWLRLDADDATLQACLQSEAAASCELVPIPAEPPSPPGSSATPISAGPAPSALSRIPSRAQWTRQFSL